MCFFLEFKTGAPFELKIIFVSLCQIDVASISIQAIIKYYLSIFQDMVFLLFIQILKTLSFIGESTIVLVILAPIHD